MKIRTLAILATLFAISWGTRESARAQQRDNPPANADRAAQRERLARLRARIQLLTLEHDNDTELVKLLVHDVHRMELMDAMKEQLPGVIKALGEVLGHKVDADKLGNIDEEFSIDAAIVKALRPHLTRKREEYLRQTEELQILRLELADLEAAYRSGSH